MKNGSSAYLSVEPICASLYLGVSEARPSTGDVCSFNDLSIGKIMMTPHTSEIPDLSSACAKLISPTAVDLEGTAGVRVDGGVQSSINAQLVMIQSVHELLG